MSAAASDKTTNNAAVLEDLSKFIKSTEILELGISQYAFNKSKKGKVLIINNINFPAKMEQYLRKEYISNNFKKYFEEEDKIDQEYSKSKNFNAECFKKAFKWEYIEDCTKYKKNPVNELRALRLRPGGTTESEKTIKEMCAKFLPQSSPQYHQDLSAQGMTDVLKKFAGKYIAMLLQS
uniref:Uncharacterized protein n=1 Tax=Plectus sambesii TaxID=2011161 RepID=A0A914ULQ9_9BILA